MPFINAFTLVIILEASSIGLPITFVSIVFLSRITNGTFVVVTKAFHRHLNVFNLLFVRMLGFQFSPAFLSKIFGFLAMTFTLVFPHSLLSFSSLLLHLHFDHSL